MDLDYRTAGQQVSPVSARQRKERLGRRQVVSDLPRPLPEQLAN